MVKLIQKSGAELVGVACLMELEFFNPRSQWGPTYRLKGRKNRKCNGKEPISSCEMGSFLLQNGPNCKVIYIILVGNIYYITL